MAPPCLLRSVALMFERIVVGYAGDRAGRDGMLLATRLAGLCSAQLTIVFPYHPLFATETAEAVEQRIRAELQALLGSHPALEHARLHWSNASWPIRALHELAEFEHADLIVFGAAPEHLGRRHLSLMERMVHGAPCSVAVAPDTYADSQPPPIRRVGVGFTDTAEGRAAAFAAGELATAAAEPLSIVSGSGLTAGLAGYAAMSPDLPEVEQEMYEQATAAAERLVDELDAPAHIEVRRGEPTRVLVDATRALDLLVLGSRGYGPLRQVLLGGVSAEVMRRASCPVLVMPRPTQAQVVQTTQETAVAER